MIQAANILALLTKHMKFTENYLVMIWIDSI